MTKHEKQMNELRFNESLALSKFTAEMLGRDDYKNKQGGANYYPSDCLYEWFYTFIDEDKHPIRKSEMIPTHVAGVFCMGCVHMRDAYKAVIVWFKDL